MLKGRADKQPEWEWPAMIHVAALAGDEDGNTYRMWRGRQDETAVGKYGTLRCGWRARKGVRWRTHNDRRTRRQ